MEHGSNTRVVVLFPGALGDLVLVLPTLVRLRLRHVGEHLTLAVAGWLEALAATSGVADTTVSLDAADTAGLFGGTRFPTWMRDRPIVYSWIGARDATARRRLAALASRLELANVIRGDGSEHAASAYARQVGVADPEPFAWPPQPITERVARLKAEIRGPLLVVHAGAGSPAKRWAHGGFAEIARRWHDEGGAVLELVGPADHDVVPLGARRALDWPLPEIVTLLAHADGYVGNDSGVTHLAASAGASGVGIYGPTAARRWSPFGRRLSAIQVDEQSGDGIGAAASSVERVWRSLASRRAAASSNPPSRS